MIKRALISVSDKDGVVDFARRLYAKGVEILSTGGTAKLLRENGVDAVEVSQFTGHPEIMGGRVKTLDPKIHGALLAKADDPEHMEQAKKNGIKLIDLVAVNLYPFAETVAKKGVTEDEAIEQIDIGGPSMLRSAAKNFARVTVVSDPCDYERVAEEIEAEGDTSPETRRRLAEKVFLKTAQYDTMIANYLTGGAIAAMVGEKIQDLRYGENPHQKAAFYIDQPHGEACIPNAKIHQGKTLSYNNIMDADAALSMVREFKEPTAVFVKHANPCGAATAKNISDAFINAYGCDPKSAFGGVIALNRTCTADLAEAIVNKFFEIVLAPDFEEEALEKLKAKPDLRVLGVGPVKNDPPYKTLRKVSGGLLVQDSDTKKLTEKDLKTVTKKAPGKQEMSDMLFAWHMVKHVKSNAIVLAKNGMTVGIGAGQMSRVDAVDIAVRKAGDRCRGTVMASDAFFPFADSVEAAAAAGITAIIQPGGSKRDEEVIAAADKLGLAMVFTDVRAFLH